MLFDWSPGVASFVAAVIGSVLMTCAYAMVEPSLQVRPYLLVCVIRGLLLGGSAICLLVAAYAAITGSGVTL